MAVTVLRNAIVQPFSTRTPLLSRDSKSQEHDPVSGVSYVHTKFFQGLENGVNGSVQIVATVPANSNSAGEPGFVAMDANFLYYCYAANKWRRIAGSPF